MNKWPCAPACIDSLELGAPCPDPGGKQGTAIVRFPVPLGFHWASTVRTPRFLFICRLLQRENEAKSLAEEEEEARKCSALAP